MALQFGCGPAGMRSGYRNAGCAVAKFFLQFIREVQIGDFAVSVSLPFLILSRLPIQIFKIEFPEGMGHAAHIDHPAVRGLLDEIDQQPRECEMTKVIGAQLQLEAVGCLGIRGTMTPALLISRSKRE